jgi:hypothetical protein
MRRRQLILAALVLGLAPDRVVRAAPPPAPLSFAELYAASGVLGLSFSEKLKSLAGTRVAIAGYMAPPLKAEADFFVLTRAPVALCPFCDSDASWPDDIVVVHLGEAVSFLPPSERIVVEGTLEVGSKTDPKTGFVSRVRIVDARFRKA